MNSSGATLGAEAAAATAAGLADLEGALAGEGEGEEEGEGEGEIGAKAEVEPAAAATACTRPFDGTGARGVSPVATVDSSSALLTDPSSTPTATSSKVLAEGFATYARRLTIIEPACVRACVWAKG